MAAWARDIDIAPAINSDSLAMAIDAIVFDPDGRAAVAVCSLASVTTLMASAAVPPRHCSTREPRRFWSVIPRRDEGRLD